MTAAQPLTITLSDAIVLGLRRNRTIRSAYLGRISDKFSLRVVENSFNPQLALNGSYTANHDPTGNSRTAEVTPTATLTSKIGTQFSLSWANQTGSVSDPLGTGSALDTQIADNTLSTSSQVATLSVTQPLLRGAGYKIATAPLRQARLDELANKLTLKSSVSDTVTNIISAYYELLRAQEQLKIARDGLSRSRELLSVNQDMIAAGRMAKFDAVQTEADVATQELTVEESANQLDTNRLALLQLLALDTRTQITTVDAPVAQRTEISLKKAMAAAFAQQPAYLTQLLTTQKADINLDVARNQQLWDVSLVAAASRVRAPGAGNGQQSWQAGVQVSIPIGDLNRKKQEVDARVEVEKQKLLLAEVRQTLEQDVTNAVRDLGTRWRQYEIAQRARDLSQRKLEVEREKLKTGRSSNFQVLSFESDLRNAENASLNAMIAYLNSQSALDKTLGTTLKSWEIELND